MILHLLQIPLFPNWRRKLHSPLRFSAEFMETAFRIAEHQRSGISGRIASRILYLGTTFSN
jgi:hypothetical protein